jgi:sodium-dependent dicarboxylate transporter 2/3/5
MWIFHSKDIGVANISILSAALFFVLNIVSWEEAKKDINWGTILMYGGAIAVGKCLVETGLLDYISKTYISEINFSLFSFIAFFSIVSLLLTQVISNSAVVIILLPIAIKIASVYNFSPVLTTFIIAIPSGLDFMFPIGSPPNAIAFSSGFIKLSEFVKTGLFLNILVILVFIASAVFYWPLIHIY